MQQVGWLEGEPGVSCSLEKQPCVIKQGGVAGAPCAEAGVEGESVREEWDPVWTPESQCILFWVWFEQPCSPLSSAHGQHGPGPV